MAITTEQRAQLIEVYVASFNRAPDAAGLSYWSDQMGGGMSLEQIARSFFVQPEAQAFYPSFLTTGEFVDRVYNNVLNRNADDAGKAYWVAQLDDPTSGIDRAKFLLAVVNAAKTSSNAEDRAIIANKEAVGEYFAMKGLNDLALAKSSMLAVTPSADSVTQAQMIINAGSGSGGVDYTLTTGIDSATAVNFYASETRYDVDGHGPTINPGDVLTGAATSTNNTLLITDLTPSGVANGNMPAGVKISNIQNVTLNSSNNTAGGTGFSTVGFAGVKNTTVITNGGLADLVSADNGSLAGSVASTVTATHNGYAGNLTIVGGSDVTATTVGGNIIVGNSAQGRVPLASEKTTGAIVVNQNFSGAGAVGVFGGTTVNVTTSSTSNTGAINIGNTGANTGNNTAGAVANPTGTITVAQAGTGAVISFGGSDVAITNTALAGAGAVTVGDATRVAASNQPTGNVTITETAQIAYNGLAGSSNNATVSGAINVYGGKDVTITTNAANAVNIGNLGAANETSLNPTGVIKVTNTGVESAAAAGAMLITGGTDVTVTTTGSNVTIGRTANAVVNQTSNPTGNVTVTETMNGAGFGRTVTIDGGKDITVSGKGQTVAIGTAVASAPTGAVVVNQADIFTGNTNAVLNGTNAGNITVDGGTTVTVNTTGGNVTVGGVVGGVNTVPSGAVKITNTFGGVGADTATVRGGTTVDITTTKTSGAINVGGVGSVALNSAGTALKDANLAPTGNVTIVNKTVSGSATAYGAGNVDVYTNGATTVSVTGGDADNIIDIQSTLATGGSNAGKAIGTSTLKNVVVSNGQAADNLAIKSDVLENLTITNAVNKTETVTVTNNTAAHALTLTQGGNTTNAAHVITVVDAKAGSITIKDNGTASTSTLQVDATKATAVTLENTAAAKVKLDGVASDIATVTLKGAGASTLVGTLGTGSLSKAMTVDASAATGNVTAALQMTTTTDAVQSYKGGSGVDTITVNSNASGWSSKATIDGGNGSADVLVADYAAAGTDVAMGNAANVKGFEVLRLGAAANSGAGNYDASGFSTVQVGAVAGAAAGVAFSNAATGLTLDVRDNTVGTGAATVTVTGSNYSATTTAMTVNLGTANTAAAGSASNAKVIGATTGAITTNGIEALTINSVDNLVTAGAATVGNAATVNGVPTNGAATLTVGGAGNLTLTSNSGFTSINASGNTGSTVDVSAAKVSNSGTTFTGGASYLKAAGSNDGGYATVNGATVTSVTAATVKGLVTIGATGNALTVGQTITVNIDGTTFTYTAAGNATATQVAADIAAAINAQAGPGVRGTITQTGANVLSATGAVASGGNIVLQHNTAFEVQATKGGGVAATTTVADSLLGGQQVDAMALSGTVAAGDTVTVTVNGVALAGGPTYTVLAGDVVVGDNAASLANVATKLAAAITAANPAGVSSAVASGAQVLLTSQLGQTNLVAVASTGGAATTLASTPSVNMTTINNEFVTGAGGGEYKAGLGGSFNTTTKKFGSGSETVNLAASTSKVDTLVLREGAVVTDNGSKGGVTAFTVGSQAASDALVFQKFDDSDVQNKTIVANAVTGVVNTLNNAANMAAVFDSTGALNTKLANLTYTISNGVITFGATGGNSLSQFTVNELINAAQIIVSSSTTGGANKVVAFSHNGKSFVVATDNANTLAGSTGAGSNTNNVVVELKDVASVKGFGSTFGENTIVSSTVTNLTNATIDLAALATSSTLDYTGFAKATLAVPGTAAANTNTTKFNNLAASAELVVNANAVGPNLGLLETTQVGTSGMNSLTVTQTTTATTIDRLTVNGDAMVKFQNGGQAFIVTELVDATNTMNNVTVGAGAGATTISKITGTALTSVNTVAATGAVTLGNGTAIAQNDVAFSLAVGTNATITTTGTGNVFTQGTATTSGAGVVTLTASGANNTITLSNGANVITANGAGDKITVGTGSNTITATGADDVITIAAAAAVTTVTVGTNAAVTVGTDDVVKVNGAVSGGTADNFAKTTISFAANTVPAGNIIDFDDATPVVYGLLGASMALSQVNVASATSLTEALNMSANYTLLVQDQGTAASTANLAGNTAAITWFQYSGDTYVVAMVNNTASPVQQTALDANDIVVKLTGLVDLTASTFAGGAEALTL